MNKRTESAYLAKARHNLKNPVNAILGYSEMLIEDCEDENLNALVSDLVKLNKAGNDVLDAIDDNFDENNLSENNKSIMDVARDTEIAIRTPLTTIIGYSELIIEDNDKIKLDNFYSDMEKIIQSGKQIELELKSIMQFKDHLEKGIKLKSLDDSDDYSMVEDVLSSIKPLNREDRSLVNTGTILAVDDNVNNTDILKKRLERLGNRVLTANNGKEGIDILSSNWQEIDLILLDIVMPEMNGFEVLRHVKGSKIFKSIPVIMISSMDDKDSIYRCIEMGANDYVTKPFDKEILNARISTSIERKQLRDKEKELINEIKIERDKSEKLLLNILPKEIAKKLKNKEKNISKRHENITIIFTDLVNFTPQAKNLKADKVVKILNQLFKSFDDLTLKHGLEKIKTIGDSYFAAGGLTGNVQVAAKNTINLSKDMVKATNSLNDDTDFMDLQIRIGIHTGNVIAGIIGKNKFAYDLWGATVNFASRLESTCEPGKIQISEDTKAIIGEKLDLESRKDVQMKGIGIINTYYLNYT